MKRFSYCVKRFAQRYLVIILMFLCSCFPLFAEAVRRPGDSSYKSTADQTAFLYVDSSVSGASVYLNGTYKGTTPLKISSLKPGSYTVRTSLKHYSEFSASVRVRPGHNSVFAYMEKISGYLHLDSVPSGAEVYCAGERVYGNNIELDEGRHTVKVRKFGMKEFKSSVYVTRRSTTRLTIAMEKAPFEITDFRVSKSSFNPRNPGDLGNVDVHYSVTAPESGVIAFRNAGGNIIFQKDVDFYTWDGSFSWIGTDFSDYIVDDGIYTLTLYAGGLERECSVEVDSGIVYPLLSITPGGLGIGGLTSAELSPRGAFQIEGNAGVSFRTVGEPEGFYSVPIHVALAWTVSRYVELSTSVDVSIIPEKTSVNGSFAIKAGDSVTFPNDASLLYAFFARIGFRSSPVMYPYGCDSGSGLGAGVSVGYKTENFYLGAQSSIIFRPVVGLVSNGSDTMWKNGIMVRRIWRNASLGAYGSINSCFGEYEFKTKDVVHKDSFAGWFRSFDTGIEGAVYLGNTSAAFTARAGFVYFPQGERGTMYPQFSLGIIGIL
ncbi:MAG TPA: hypothetical protein DEO40_07395 [Treponema sp.]|nr:hypothetical protein [Treponema sp.]HCA20484.1 hypothetical protein [Treponema sp.]